MRAYQGARQHLLNSTSIPDLESYIDLRRDASGFRMMFDLIEYAGGLNLPDHALVHPILKHLTEQACDLMAWSEVWTSLRHSTTELTSILGCGLLCSRYKPKFTTQHRRSLDEGTQMLVEQCPHIYGHARQAECGNFSSNGARVRCL